jgi:hypothetical protein
MSIRFLIIFLFLPFVAHISWGQITFQNLTLLNPDTNILYLGIENKIQINGIEDYSKIKLTVTGATMHSKGKGLFIIRASTKGTVNLLVYDNMKLLVQKKYIATHYTTPTVKLGKFRDTTLSVFEILQNKQLVSSGSLLHFPVIKFYNSIISDNKLLYSDLRSNGPYLSDELIRILIKLKSADKIIFENIQLRGPDDMWVNPIFITIK